MINLFQVVQGKSILQNLATCSISNIDVCSTKSFNYLSNIYKNVIRRMSGNLVR